MMDSFRLNAQDYTSPEFQAECTPVSISTGHSVHTGEWALSITGAILPISVTFMVTSASQKAGAKTEKEVD